MMKIELYLPPGRSDIPAFCLAQLLLDLVTTEGCKAEDLVGWLNTEMMYLPNVGHQSEY